MSYLQDFKEDATVRFSFTTNDGAGGRVAPSSAFAASDLRIYKNGSATQKTSTNGITVTSPFDSMVGVHHVDIDTSNDTDDAGFWVANADYEVVLYPSKTVDGESVSAVVAEFSIENRYTSNSDEDLGTITAKIGTPVALDGGAATLGSMLTKMADDSDGADYDAGTDSLATAGTLAAMTNFFAVTTNNNLLDAILNDTNELQGDDVPGLIAALLAEMFSLDSGETEGSAVDGSLVKEIAERIAKRVRSGELASLPSQTVPSHEDMLAFVYEYFRNRGVSSPSQKVLYAADGTTPLATWTQTEVAGIFEQTAAS